MRRILQSLFLFSCFSSLAQLPYTFSFSKTKQDCNPAEVSVQISGTHNRDTVNLSWSTGEQNVTKVTGISGGEYSLRITIIHHDSLRRYFDTTLTFTIEKEDCNISVGKFFTPNDDSYNDLLYISNVQYYPDFEFEVFNKWGQRVHHQKNTFQPWDGKWNGFDLPDGTYYFVFFYSSKNKKRVEKGDITILR